MHQRELSIATGGRGCTELTGQVQAVEAHLQQAEQAAQAGSPAEPQAELVGEITTLRAASAWPRTVTSR